MSAEFYLNDNSQHEYYFSHVQALHKVVLIKSIHPDAKPLQQTVHFTFTTCFYLTSTCVWPNPICVEQLRITSVCFLLLYFLNSCRVPEVSFIYHFFSQPFTAPLQSWNWVFSPCFKSPVVLCTLRAHLSASLFLNSGSAADWPINTLSEKVG